jgi:hypothetical protein
MQLKQFTPSEKVATETNAERYERRRVCTLFLGGTIERGILGASTVTTWLTKQTISNWEQRKRSKILTAVNRPVGGGFQLEPAYRRRDQIGATMERAIAEKT